MRNVMYHMYHRKGNIIISSHILFPRHTSISSYSNNFFPPIKSHPIIRPDNKPHIIKMSKEESSHYVLPLNQPVVSLDCDVAFNGLTNKEKLYAHYLSQASWYGGLCVPVQVIVVKEFLAIV